jgi:ABC-type dipeptide/oligopeptide/nickel transport system ATPase subunit
MAAPQDSGEDSGRSLLATEPRLVALDPEKTRQVYSPITDQDEAVISRIATTASLPQVAPLTHQGVNTIEEDDSAINPSSVRFEPYKWAQKRLSQLDEEGVLRQHAGVVFKNLNVSGSGAALQLQNTVDSVLLAPFRSNSYRGLIQSSPKRQILHSFDGVLKSGEMLMVLGRPGSGCSTFQKAICGELHGLNIHTDSIVHYNGIPREKMHAEFKGECVYNQEVDKHFPHLTVGETLEFAAAARTPSQRLPGVSRYDFIKETSQVIMAVLGLSHTYNTRGQLNEIHWQAFFMLANLWYLVGNDYIRGVSGGERKRVRYGPSGYPSAVRTLTQPPPQYCGNGA